MHAAIASITAHFRSVTPVTTWSFVRVRCADGAEGWGEATINGQAREIGEEVARQDRALRGCDSTPADAIAPIAPGMLGWAVVSAVDQALWDIAARRAGRGLAGCLVPGSGADGVVPLYANINRGITERTPEQFGAAAAGAVEAGFAAVKIAPFDGLTPGNATEADGQRFIRAGLDRVAAAHAAIGGRARLMVDCHWRFTEATAEAALREAARIGIAWFECPLPETAETVAAVRRLRGIANAAGVQLAGLETASRLEAFLAWTEAYDVVMPDVKYAGGLAETLRIARELSARGMGVSLHNPTGSVCHAVSLHVSAAIGGELPLEIQWGETPLLFDLPCPALPRPEAGASRLPEGPGHGAVLHPAKLDDVP